MSIYRITIAFLLMILLASTQIVFSQHDSDRDYQKFKKYFDQEIGQTIDDTNRLNTYVLHPASLPGWFFKVPQSENNTFYAIGISDPGLNPQDALEMAVLRAKCIFAFMLEPDVVSLADNYSDEKPDDRTDEFNTKYISYFQVRSVLKFNDNDFTLVEKNVTSFDEAVVLLRYTPGIENSLLFTAEANVYQVERQKNNASQMEEKYHIKGILNNQCPELFSLDYTIYSINNIYEIKSVQNQILYNYPCLNYKYAGRSNSKASDSIQVFRSKLNYGLWKSFLEVFLQEMYVLSQNQPVKIKQVGDDYTSRTQHLSREITRATPAVKINLIDVYNNHLYIHLDYTHK